MPAVAKPAAIAGVSASTEAEIMTVYPSIAAWGLGRALGSLYDCIPLRLGSIKLSYLLFVLPTAPLAAGLYILQKLSGQKYVLTNRSVQVWQSFGVRKIEQISLTDITEVVVREEAGQHFFKAGDILLIGPKGAAEITLSGVPYPYIFRNTILEARDARLLVQKSLDTIKARPVMA